MISKPPPKPKIEFKACGTFVCLNTKDAQELGKYIYALGRWSDETQESCKIKEKPWTTL
jgi:hypothetical protein